MGPELRVELKAEKKALLVGETITVDCVARGSEMLEDHWKYPGKLVSYTGQDIYCKTVFRLDFCFEKKRLTLVF